MSENKVLRVYTAANHIKVIDNENYIINELIMQDVITGFPHWSTIFVTLHGKKQSPWFSNQDADMRYAVTAGEGWFLIGTQGEVVVAGAKLLIPRGRHHMILNNTMNDLTYTIDVSGNLDFREYIGVPVIHKNKS